MGAVEIRRRVSQKFFTDDTDYERMPAYRSDGTKIDNEFEWQLAEVIVLGMQAAKEMLTNDIREERTIGSVGGHTTNLDFHFTIWRNGPCLDGAPNGPRMAISCDVVKYKKKKGNCQCLHPFESDVLFSQIDTAPLNLYLLTQGDGDYDTYDSAVVAAANEEDARRVEVGSIGECGSWCLPEFVKVKHIGRADDGIKAGEIVCASYNVE